MQASSQAADAIHAKVAAELQQELQQSRRAPVVQRRPQPEPFGTLPMASNIPPSNLPDPVRFARAGGIAPAMSAPPGLEPALAQAPHVGLVPDVGGSVSVQNVIGLGTGVLESMLADGKDLVYRAADGRGYQLPLSCLELRLPLEEIAALHEHQVKDSKPVLELLQLPAVPVAASSPPLADAPAGVPVAHAGSAPSTVLMAVGARPELPAVPALLPAPAQHLPLLPAPAEHLPLQPVEAQLPAAPAPELAAAKSLPLQPVDAALHAVAAAVAQLPLPRSQLTTLEVDPGDWEYDPDELSSSDDEEELVRPHHLSRYEMVNGIVVATSPWVPEVYSFPSGPSPSSMSFRATSHGPLLKTKKAILDTGANLVLASLDWVERNELLWQPTNTLKMRTSSGASFSACGRLQQPLIIVLCANTQHELKVAVDCYVMTEQTDLYDLLIGTPLLNAVGGAISSFDNTFTYRPQLHVEGGDVSIKQSIAICTYTNTAGPRYRESSRFLISAACEWICPGGASVLDGPAA